MATIAVWIFNGICRELGVFFFCFRNAHATDLVNSFLFFFLFVPKSQKFVLCFGMFRTYHTIRLSRRFFSGSVNFRHALSFRRRETPQQSIMNRLYFFFIYMYIFLSHGIIITMCMSHSLMPLSLF